MKQPKRLFRLFYKLNKADQERKILSVAENEDVLRERFLKNRMESVFITRIEEVKDR